MTEAAAEPHIPLEVCRVATLPELAVIEPELFPHFPSPRASMRAATQLTRASRPFSLNQTGTLSRRHLAHFVAAVDTPEGSGMLSSLGSVPPVALHFRSADFLGAHDDGFGTYYDAFDFQLSI